MEEKERKKAKAAEEKEAKRLASEEKKASKAKAKAAPTDEGAATAAEPDEGSAPNLDDPTPEHTQVPATQVDSSDEQLAAASAGLDGPSPGEQPQESLPQPEELLPPEDPPHPDDPRVALEPCPWNACQPYDRVCTHCKDYRVSPLRAP